MLSVGNFLTILDKVPKHVRGIDFSGMAEPFANPDATTMLTETLARGYNVTVYTTLVGMSRDEAGIVAALLFMHREQVETLVIHLPDAAGNMRGFKPSDDYRAALDIFVEIGPRLRSFEMMTMHAKQRLHPAVAHLRTRQARESGYGFPVTRAGSLDESEIGGQGIERKPQHATPVSCSYTPFYDHNVLLPDGSVVLCCMDYSLKHKLGNLLEQDYYDIFASPGDGAPFTLRTRELSSPKRAFANRARAREVLSQQRGTRQFWEAIE